MNKLSFAFFGMLTLALLWTGCTKEDPVVPNQEEVITTLTYTLTPTGGTPVVMTFKDLDGDGGNAPVITGGTLMANTTYTGAIVLLNETETPAENITLEITEEAAEHQFFFESTVTGTTVAYGDLDTNGKPIGLVSTVTTGAAGTGNLKVTLRHEPNKDATGVAGGDITNAGGETDIEVTFPIDVQ